MCAPAGQPPSPARRLGHPGEPSLGCGGGGSPPRRDSCLPAAKTGAPLLTSRRKEKPTGVVLLRFQAALWRCGSRLYSPPLHGVFRQGCLHGWHHFEHRLLSPTERPRTPPRPLPTRACAASLDLPVGVAWLWSHGGVISQVLLLSLAIMACRPTHHGLQAHPGQAAPGLPSSLRSSNTPLRAGVDFTCPVCPWELGVCVTSALGGGELSLECFTAGRACHTTTQVVYQPLKVPAGCGERGRVQC